MPFFDSHCHINAREFDSDREDVITRMKSSGLVGALVLGCDRDEVAPTIALAKENPGFLYAAWALHPEYEDAKETSVEEISRICSVPEIVAVGETGLDYHWCKGDLTWQKNRFRMHIEAAKALHKPIVVHAREAEADALAILKEEKASDVGFVLHCYGGDLETAKETVDFGGMISLTGVVTFKNAENLREIVRQIPLENLMIETDCPYMAPVPYRGKRNEPSFVLEVARTIAKVKGLTLEKVGEKTTENAVRFFRIREKSL